LLLYIGSSFYGSLIDYLEVLSNDYLDASFMTTLGVSSALLAVNGALRSIYLFFKASCLLFLSSL
jgi:hypothetical protein